MIILFHNQRVAPKIINVYLAKVHGLYSRTRGTTGSESQRSVRLNRLEELCSVSIGLDLVHKINQCWTLICEKKTNDQISLSALDSL
jgi:hypothetical protein